MSHVVKYLVITLASMAMIKAGVIHLPLPPDFPEINVMFIKELSITGANWNNARRQGNQNPFPHILEPLRDKLMTFQETERHLLTGGSIVWERILLEGSYTETRNSGTIINNYFNRKLAAGVRMKQNIFLKLNVTLWEPGRISNTITHCDYVVYPSILWKTAWFNVDIGFGPDRHIDLQQVDLQPQPVKALLQDPDPQVLKKWPLVDHSLKINISLNALSLGSQ